MKEFELVDDLTSDVMFKIYGKDEKELFKNSAKALFSIITNKNSKVKPKKKIKINIKGEDLKSLFFNWLNELIAFVDIEEMFFSKFEILKITPTELIAEIYGEPISEERAGTLVKAPTYYGFELKKEKNGFTAIISFDI